MQFYGNLRSAFPLTRISVQKNLIVPSMESEGKRLIILDRFHRRSVLQNDRRPVSPFYFSLFISD